MVKCKVCGGTCSETGNGKYMCDFCGALFSERDLMPAKRVAERQTAAAGMSGADVFEQNIAGTLEISVRGRAGAWSGSGYIVTDDGYAVTNAHVAADEDGSPCRNIIARVNGQSVSASVVALADDKAGAGSGIDLAIIKLASMPKGAKKLLFEDSDAIRNGEPVFVIGNSLGMGVCITSGIVSDRARVLSGKQFIMTDCAVNGGNSGGPIFNAKGLVIGTITLQGRAHDGGDAEGMNYAIPANVVKAFLQANVCRF